MMFDFIEQNTEGSVFFFVLWHDIGAPWSCLQWKGAQTVCFLLSFGPELLQIFRVLANSHYSRRYSVFNNVVYWCLYSVRSSILQTASFTYSYVSSHGKIHGDPTTICDSRRLRCGSKSGSAATSDSGASL